MTAVREIRLKSRPNGAPTSENFEVATVDLPAPEAIGRRPYQAAPAGGFSDDTAAID